MTKNATAYEAANTNITPVGLRRTWSTRPSTVALFELVRPAKWRRWREPACCHRKQLAARKT